MQTENQQKYHQKKCKYCSGTGCDIFNRSKPCPNCNKEPVLIRDTGNLQNRLSRMSEEERGEYSDYMLDARRDDLIDNQLNNKL